MLPEIEARAAQAWRKRTRVQDPLQPPQPGWWSRWARAFVDEVHRTVTHLVAKAWSQVVLLLLLGLIYLVQGKVATR